jgi:two-component system, LytTR family, sensor kinase
MRRADGLVRQAETQRWRAWVRMLLMARDKPLGFPSYWQLQLMGWACFYLLGVVGSIPDVLRRPAALRDHTVIVFFMFLASCALRPCCRSLLRRELPWLAFELRAGAWCVLWGTVSAFAARLTLLGPHKMNWAGLTAGSTQSAFLLFLWCSLYFHIKQWQQSGQERERLLRAETEVREARLRALHYQLNPHFLFNSLNAVSTLVLDGNAAAATRMLAQIGDFLRTSLDNDVVPEVALSREMAFTEQYLAIEQTRLGERLRVDFSMPSDTLNALVPSMLLQPLVENAVRHGVAPLVEGGRIAIESRLSEGRLRIVIRNSGRRGSQRETNGIGLSNTVDRLKTLYGSDYKFLMEWPERGGCEVTVELPFRGVHEELPCAH